MSTINLYKGALVETAQASSEQKYFSDEELDIIVHGIFYDCEKKAYVKRSEDELMGDGHKEGLLDKLGYTKFQARCIVSDIRWHVPNIIPSVLNGRTFFDYLPQLRKSEYDD